MMGEVKVIHSQVCSSVDYLEVREQIASNAATTCARSVDPDAHKRPLPPPLRPATVARRRARLRALRRSSQADLWQDAVFKEVAAQLRGRGFAVVDDFYGAREVQTLRTHVAALEMRRGVMGGAMQSTAHHQHHTGFALRSSVSMLSRGMAIAWSISLRFWASLSASCM